MPARRNMIAAGAVAALLPLGAGLAQARGDETGGPEPLLKVDATRQPAPPRHGHLDQGSRRSPGGGELGINSRYLTRNGRPWLPVMGEMHFTRVPRAEWDAQLAKIRASGVDIVATYVFWNHHEPIEGRIDFAGDRSLRAFIEAAARHDLKVFLRIGPWVHAEARYGGLPDWIVARGPRRRNEAGYLAAVERFWTRLTEEARGLLWKDGGPVIGTQIENEYNLTGEGRGREHIAALKKLAVRLGFDTPYYTVTGWDRTIWPSGEVVPVYGGYPDEPWSARTGRLPPKETYLFRFDSRVSGDLGAQTRGGARGDAEADAALTPFLGAEYGGGVPTMYRRRPLIRPDDIAAMLPVQLGSGVNLYGYYMYHGGRNPDGPYPLREQTALGGYNDVPLVEYDFQAPFGQYGQAQPVLAAVRPYHYFLNAFGERLAPMAVHAPAVLPSGTGDLATPRWSVRSAGDSAFLFFNNHVRQYPMAEQRGVRFEVALPGGPVRFPGRPMTIPDGAHGVLPIGFALDGGVRLDWATVQPVTRLGTGAGPLWVFAAIPGLPAELAFPPGVPVRGAGVAREDGRQVVRLDPLRRTLLEAGGQRILILPASDARRLSIVTVAGRQRLLLTEDELAPTTGGLDLISRDDARFELSVFPADGLRPGPGWRAAREGLFTRYSTAARPVDLPVRVRKLRGAGVVPPLEVGGPANTVMEPYPESFDLAAAWALEVPALPPGVEDVHLDIAWRGDVGRLFLGNRMVDDHYFDGRSWRVGLRRFLPSGGARLELAILPLRGDSPVYIDDAVRPAIGRDAQLAELRSVRAVPQYRASFLPGTPPR